MNVFGQNLIFNGGFDGIPGEGINASITGWVACNLQPDLLPSGACVTVVSAFEGSSFIGMGYTDGSDLTNERFGQPLINKVKKNESYIFETEASEIRAICIWNTIPTLSSSAYIRFGNNNCNIQKTIRYTNNLSVNQWEHYCISFKTDADYNYFSISGGIGGTPRYMVADDVKLYKAPNLTLSGTNSTNLSLKEHYKINSYCDIRFDWFVSDSGSILYNGDTASVTWSYIGIHNITVTATSISQLSEVDRIVFPITVSGIPPAKASILGPITVCNDSLVNYTISRNIIDSLYVSFTGGNLITQIGNNFKFKLTIPGIGNLIATTDNQTVTSISIYTITSFVCTVTSSPIVESCLGVNCTIPVTCVGANCMNCFGLICEKPNTCTGNNCNPDTNIVKDPCKIDPTPCYCPPNLCDTVKPPPIDSISQKKQVVFYSAFSPNGDGYNEFWSIDGVESYKTISLSIFDIWGNIVYNTNWFDNKWNGNANAGTPLSAGVYYYLVEIKEIGLTKSGSVAIIR
ncbi:MAG: gliding motility-associated C-terminal domain-containing protein [Bacteroidota bacterium]|nr:gliding motility-associated C-terminal domain-containing protein [Bacteroidota bacterium]